MTPHPRVALAVALPLLITLGCSVKQGTASSFHCPTDGTVPQWDGSGYSCVAPDSLPISALLARNAAFADDAGTSADAGIALKAASAAVFDPAGRIVLGNDTDGGESLVVSGGFHVQGFPVIGRVGVYSGGDALDGGMLTIQTPAPSSGNYRYRLSGTLTADAVFPAFQVCDVAVYQSEWYQQYQYLASKGRPANFYVEDDVSRDAGQLVIEVIPRPLADGGTEPPCKATSLTAVLEVVQ